MSIHGHYLYIIIYVYTYFYMNNFFLDSVFNCSRFVSNPRWV